MGAIATQPTFPVDRALPGRLRLPVQASVQVAFGVFVTPDPAAPLSPESVIDQATQWVDHHAGEAFQSSAIAYLKSGQLTIDLCPATEISLPPLELLAHMGMGEVESHRLRLATDVVIMAAEEPNLHPRIGLLSALAAARAIAKQLGGVVYEPSIPRVHPISSYDQILGATGDIAATNHVYVAFSVGKVGLGWMTTKGMSTFGLPDLEIRDCPPNLSRLAHLANAVAKRLIETALRREAGREGGDTVLEISDELEITIRDLSAATGRESAPDQPIRRTKVRLELGHRGGKTPALIAIKPPAGFTGEHGVWLNAALAELLGTEPSAQDSVRPGNAMVEAAHRRAVAELPQIKDRFQRGLAPGETLYVKHGIALEDGARWFAWIVVTRWSGRILHGQLASDPRDIPVSGLKLGQHLTLDEDHIFDWLIERGDADQEGGYTRLAAFNERH